MMCGVAAVVIPAPLAKLRCAVTPVQQKFPVTGQGQKIPRWV